MRGIKDNELLLNQVGTSLVVFVASYNKSIPVSFPQASVKTLKRFRALHPALFKSDGEWSIDKHRKRVMDWLSTYGNVV